jgi:hypothetical protein
MGIHSLIVAALSLLRLWLLGLTTNRLASKLARLAQLPNFTPAFLPSVEHWMVRIRFLIFHTCQ